MSADPTTRRRATGLALAAAVAVGWHALDWVMARRCWPPPTPLRGIEYAYWLDLATLAYGIALVLPAPRRSGLVGGDVGAHWKGVVAVCGVPIAATAVVYPLLGAHAFAGWSSSMWTISPAGQDLAFFGCAYRVLERGWSGRVVRRLPVEWPLFWTATVFTLWHVPNFAGMAAGYVVFQLAYVFVGACIVGLARQWTGSLLYGWIVHTAVNAIAWYAG